MHEHKFTVSVTCISTHSLFKRNSRGHCPRVYVCVDRGGRNVSLEECIATINFTWYRKNNALRYTVKARKVTAISALRGEIRSSLQISRDMNSKIFYIKHILLHNNLLKEILLQQFYEKTTF